MQAILTSCNHDSLQTAALTGRHCRYQLEGFRIIINLTHRVSTQRFVINFYRTQNEADFTLKTGSVVYSRLKELCHRILD